MEEREKPPPLAAMVSGEVMRGSKKTEKKNTGFTNSLRTARV